MVIIGPSGSGKSTLLRSLNLLEIPTAGSVFMEGMDITDRHADINLHRQKMGMVFQHFNLFPHMTILKNMTIAPMKLLKKSEAEATEKAMELLKRVGLEDRANAYPSQLSGGEQQRISIARAVCKNPKMLLCDEPTGALDYENSKQVLEIIESLNRDLGMTVVLVTHNDALCPMADKVITVHDGKIKSVVENSVKVSVTELEW